MSGFFVLNLIIYNMFYVYVLHSVKYDKIYIGQTNNTDNRLIQHNSGKHRYTKRYIPWVIIHTENFKTRSEAMRREKELKSHKGRKYIREEILNGRVRQQPD